jgi:hypothetical protein
MDQIVWKINQMIAFKCLKFVGHNIELHTGKTLCKYEMPTWGNLSDEQRLLYIYAFVTGFGYEAVNKVKGDESIPTVMLSTPYAVYEQSQCNSTLFTLHTLPDYKNLTEDEFSARVLDYIIKSYSNQKLKHGCSNSTNSGSAKTFMAKNIRLFMFCIIQAATGPNARAEVVTKFTEKNMTDNNLA